MNFERDPIDDILDPTFNFNDEDKDIETTCLKCGFTEFAPSFIYDEFSRKKYHFKLKKKVSTLYCNKCGEETAVPSSFIKNK